jgi:hypothetical protein
MSSRRQEKAEARARRLALEQQRRARVARRRRARRAAATGAALAALAGGGIAIAIGATGSGARATVATVSGAGATGATVSGAQATGATGSGAAPNGASGSQAAASAAGSGGQAAKVGPEGVVIAPGPPLAPPSAPADGHAVDGISCLAGEQVVFHIHAHLTVFVNGAARQIPGGIGIVDPQSTPSPAGAFVSNGGCFYWLHTHAADGILHIESPVRRIYALGDFFDIWGQALSANRIGPLRGPVTAFYNGRRFHPDPRQIPLTAHAQIQLEIGRRTVAPVSITFPWGL